MVTDPCDWCVSWESGETCCRYEPVEIEINLKGDVTDVAIDSVCRGLHTCVVSRYQGLH